MDIDKCSLKEYCPFAHNESDIRVELIHTYNLDDDFYFFHYKTVFCPFEFFEHDKRECVYAHNFSDYRRSPSKVSYDPKECQNWYKRFYNNDVYEILDNWNTLCDNGNSCDKSHNFFEIEFHPNLYKSKVCRKKKNCIYYKTYFLEKNRIKLCPFYHIVDDRRKYYHYFMNGLMLYKPKNRVIMGAFKYVNSEELTKPNSQKIFYDGNRIYFWDERLKMIVDDDTPKKRLVKMETLGFAEEQVQTDLSIETTQTLFNIDQQKQQTPLIKNQIQNSEIIIKNPESNTESPNTNGGFGLLVDSHG